MENMQCEFCNDTGYIEVEVESDDTQTKRCPYCNPKDEELLEQDLN